MFTRPGQRSLLVLLGAVLAVGLAGTALAQLAPGQTGKPTVVFVSPHAPKTGGPPSCWEPQFKTINAGIAAVANGGTVVVCTGTYHEDAVVNKPLKLVGGASNVTIDATGQPGVVSGFLGNGITVLSDHVSIANLTVVNAPGDGILVAGRNNVTITGVTATHNGGFGVDLNSASHSKVTSSRIRQNVAGGVNLSNDVGGPASHDLVSDNIASGNKMGCGIVLADHTGAGVFANMIAGNTVNGNGLQAFGAGIILASPIPGGSVHDNHVTGNKATGNGLGGITLHSHVPGQNFTGNSFTRNVIAQNNLTGDDPGIGVLDVPDVRTTGIIIASAGALTIRVNENVISDNHFGIWTDGPVGFAPAHQNVFLNVAVHEFAA
ncbi:MAG TPA: right-handed parallel beta-helix repeat-containing protein [Acidimicrobiia bacterium]|jgi:nitrous oxidase accessory protein NosD